MSESKIVSRIRTGKLVERTCSDCGEKYLAHRIFRDPTDGRQKCFPSCLQNEVDRRLGEGLVTQRVNRGLPPDGGQDWSG